MEREEGVAEAGREGRLRVGDSHDSSSNGSGVAGDEVVHGLGVGELADGWQDTKGIASQEDNVLGMATNSWDLDIGDVLEWVRASGILSNTNILIVHLVSTFKEANILK